MTIHLSHRVLSSLEAGLSACTGEKALERSIALQLDHFLECNMA